MDIYIESRTKKRDYYWLAKREGLSTAEEVSDIPIFTTYSRSSFVDTKEFSVVLFREQGQLLLLLTGLPTGRKDTRPRHISNSIAWIGTNADEPMLREIAALALNNNLQIPQNVVAELSNGDFEVNWEVIEQLIPSSRAKSASPEDNSKIARISDRRKQELANELMEYRLPSGDGALVAITNGFITHKYYESIGIWRGLSNDPEASNEWVVLESSPPVNPPSPNRNKNLLRGLIGGAVVIVISIALWISQQQPPPPLSLVCNKAFPTFTFIKKSQDQTENQRVETSDLSLPNKISIFYDEDPQTKTKTFMDTTNIQSTVSSLQKILIAANHKLQIKNDQLNSADGNIQYSTKLAIYNFQQKYNQINNTSIRDLGNVVDSATWNALEKTTNNDENTKQYWDSLKKEIWEDLKKKKGNEKDVKKELENVCPQ